MSLLRAAATVSSLTLLSRITGLVRDVMIARAFGASALTDAFWVAFRIPNLLRRLFAEGAFAQAFVPILGQARNEHEAPAVKQLLDRVARTAFPLDKRRIRRDPSTKRLAYLYESTVHTQRSRRQYASMVYQA